MGLRRLTLRAGRAMAGLFAAWTLMVVGVFVVFDLGWALIAAGVELGVYVIALYDVDEHPEPAADAVVPVAPVRTLREMEAERDEDGW